MKSAPNERVMFKTGISWRFNTYDGRTRDLVNWLILGVVLADVATHDKPARKRNVPCDKSSMCSGSKNLHFIHKDVIGCQYPKLC